MLSMFIMPAVTEHLEGLREQNMRYLMFGGAMSTSFHIKVNPQKEL